MSRAPSEYKPTLQTAGQMLPTEKLLMKSEGRAFLANIAIHSTLNINHTTKFCKDSEYDFRFTAEYFFEIKICLEY
jgi:hypothetical protein